MAVPRHGVVVTIAGISAAALIISLLIDDFYTLDSSEAGGLVVISLIFMISEKLVFHVEARTEAVSYSPSDIALGVGLVFFGPLGLVIARLVGASLGQLLFRRTDKIKWAFNIANFALETVIAYALCRSTKVAISEPSLSTWAGLVCSLFIALLVGGFMVAAVISCFEGNLWERLKTEITYSPVFYLPGAALAGTLAIAYKVAPFLGIAVGSLVPVIWLIVRSHGKLLHRYSDLIGAHEFSREVGDASELNNILSTAADHIASNMRGNLVAIRVWDRSGRRTEAFHGGRGLAAELPSDLAALEGSGFVATVGDTTEREDIGLVCMRVLLADEQGTVGCIAVADRLGVNTNFDIDDLRRLTAMAQQLTIAVRKGQLHAQIRYEATHDRLTGLTNRGFFEAWVNGAVSPTDMGCVLFIDLDRFKEVNDAYGHHVGDALLRAVAGRIRLASPVDGIASRFGGDEFALFAPNITVDHASELADRLAASLEEPFELGQVSVAISPSIGIVEGPSHGHVAATLMRRADIAMYEAKKRSVRYAIYRNELEEDDSARLKMLVDLRAAIIRDELEVHFQPQVDMRTGKVIGAEALARWNHPVYGSVNPTTFVELAESAGLIDALTDRVLAHSLQAAAQWQRRGWDMNIAVNISARSLLDQSLVQMVEAYLSETALDASRLTLEITESTMMTDPARTHSMLHSLTSLGVTISVDDFGTGYSSLRSLGHLPVSELKIDRSFVMAMMTSNHDAIIVRSTIDLAHNLGLKAVAEGVESSALLNQLMTLECDLAQGYGISRPLPLDRFNHWFLARSNDMSDVGFEPDLAELDTTISSPSVA